MEHGFADDFDGGGALAHEVVVEGLEVEGGALFVLHVFAELHDFEFAEGVVEVGGVGGAALGFDEAYGVGLVAFFDEEVYGLVGVQVPEVAWPVWSLMELTKRASRRRASWSWPRWMSLASRSWCGDWRWGARRRSPGRASSARCSGPSLRCWCWRRGACGSWRGTGFARGTGRSGRGRPRGRWC